MFESEYKSIIKLFSPRILLEAGPRFARTEEERTEHTHMGTH